MKLIDGKQVSASIKEGLAEQVATFPEKYGRVPHLVVVRVGEDPASVVYVRNKAKACEACGIRNTTLVLPEETSEEALLEKIRALNADPGTSPRPRSLRPSTKAKTWTVFTPTT